VKVVVAGRVHRQGDGAVDGVGEGDGAATGTRQGGADAEGDGVAVALRPVVFDHAPLIWVVPPTFVVTLAQRRGAADGAAERRRTSRVHRQTRRRR